MALLDSGQLEAFGGGGGRAPSAAGEPRPLTISQAARLVRQALETSVGEVWVEGEISNWKQHPASGHCYFTLKDESAQLAAVMWRAAWMRVDFEPRNGLLVEARGTLTFYEARGQAQIAVRELREAGVGALWKRFLELKEKLQKEGLFDESRKIPLPRFPRRVGVVTSASGAAFRDILNVLQRRFAGLEVILWPARVQGEGAAAEIARGVARLDTLGLCDVLIVGRGGGSVEDLWAFNEEIVARAVAACQTPVISAVGHEVDFTICDFVADARAPTPSAAAELVSREKAETIERLRAGRRRLSRALLDGLARKRARVEVLRRSYALSEPRARLRSAMQRRDDLAERLARALRQRLQAALRDQRRTRELRQRMALALRRRLEETIRLRDRVAERRRRLTALAGGALERARARLAAAGAHLQALSPRGVLRRGYAIVRRARDGAVLRDPKQARANEHILAELARGRLRAIVVRDEEDLFSG